jgi:hypothetical protein
MSYSLPTEFNHSVLYSSAYEAGADRLWGFHLFTFIYFLMVITRPASLVLCPDKELNEMWFCFQISALKILADY